MQISHARACASGESCYGINSHEAIKRASARWPGRYLHSHPLTSVLNSNDWLLPRGWQESKKPARVSEFIPVAAAAERATQSEMCLGRESVSKSLLCGAQRLKNKENNGVKSKTIALSSLSLSLTRFLSALQHKHTPPAIKLRSKKGKRALTTHSQSMAASGPFCCCSARIHKSSPPFSLFPRLRPKVGFMRAPIARKSKT